MKKILIIIFFSLVMAKPAMPKSTFGYLIGLNFSHVGPASVPNINNIGIYGVTYMYSTSFGIFYSYDFTRTFSMQTELMYIQKGFHWTSYGIDLSHIGKGEVTERFFYFLDYLQLPLIVKIHIPLYKIFRIYFTFGPYLSYLVSAKQVHDNPTLATGGIAKEVNIKEHFKKTDFGLMAGGGFEFVIDENRLSLDFRVSIGLIKIYKNFENSVYHRTLSILIGYGLSL